MALLSTRRLGLFCNAGYVCHWRIKFGRTSVSLHFRINRSSITVLKCSLSIGIRYTQLNDGFWSTADKKLKHCPVIHRPTFDPAKEPIVTLAMVANGACYTHYHNVQTFANALSELVRRLLVFKVRIMFHSIKHRTDFSRPSKILASSVPSNT